jgi:hypothetical protein
MYLFFISFFIFHFYEKESSPTIPPPLPPASNLGGEPTKVVAKASEDDI